MAETRNERPIYLFVYGHLKSDQPAADMMLDRSLGSAKRIGKGRTVQPFPLVVATQWNIAFLLNEPGKGKRIQGEIFEIDSKMLQSLDKFENYPMRYTRDTHQVVLEEQAPPGDKHKNNITNVGELFNCWVYQLKLFPKEAVEKCTLLENYDAWEQNSLTGSMEELRAIEEEISPLLTEQFLYDALCKAANID